MAPDAREGNNQLALVGDILNELGLDDAEASRWWRGSRHPELGDLTPAEAWSLDERASVLRLLGQWFEDTLRAEARYQRNPALIVGAA